MNALVELKLRAEKDFKLSDGAYRSLALIISDRYISHDPEDAEFKLSWSRLSAMHQGLGRSTAERRIEELTERGYIKRESLKGCPATWHYRFILRCVKNGATERRKTETARCVKNGASHIFNTFQVEKLIKKRGGACDPAAAASPPREQRTPMPLDVRRALWSAAKKKLEDY